MAFYITALLQGHRAGNRCYAEIVKSALTGTLLGCILFIPVRSECDLLKPRAGRYTILTVVMSVCFACVWRAFCRGSVWSSGASSTESRGSTAGRPASAQPCSSYLWEVRNNVNIWNKPSNAYFSFSRDCLTWTVDLYVRSQVFLPRRCFQKHMETLYVKAATTLLITPQNLSYATIAIMTWYVDMLISLKTLW